MKHLLFLIFAVQACLPGFAACDGRVRIVPRPAEVEELPGSFRLTPRTPVVITDEQLRTPAEIFARAVGKLTGTEPAVTAAPEKHAVTLQLQPGYEAEEYLLEVGRQRITVTASTPQAVLHGLRSLQQLVAGGEIPACVVRDKPTFAYRGAMLDVCRHFFPVEDVKTYIDILSLHKINKFHWHLTDDQGWRIEIKKYPLLTQIGSRRAETLVGRYDKNKEGVYDGKPYGGFYTQEEIREIVSYAAERHIEVIPEIEMPGHGLAALTAYPWLGCTGGPYAVWTHWGISDDVYCAGKETTFEFIEKVLTEVLALFPSKLIHIGGDECPKGRWKACPLCQQRIREEGLKDEYQLQSYFIHRIERWMHTHGREIIGWDEILQGGISKTANIMSWNGSDPGIKAAQRGNPVIMTPKWYCYFDYSQTSDPERYEPLGNTRYVSVRQAYRLDPCDRLTLPDQKRIRGVQCNLWTEYIASDDHLEYMLLPRLAALSEVQWCQPGVKDWVRFRDGFRMDRIYSQMGYAFAKHIFGIKGSYAVDPQKGAVVMTLTTQGDAPIHYTLDGSEPTAASPRYTGPVEIGKSARFRATALREGGENASYSREFAFSKSTGRPAVLNTKPNDSYTFEGASLLVDGYHSRPVFTSGAWLGYLDEPLDVTIDMGGEQSYRSVELETLAEKGDWIFPPSSVTVWVSDNGTDFTEVASVTVPEAKAGDADGIGRYWMQFPETSARYLKVVAQNAAAIPAWHPGAGSKGFLFVDEIVVE